MKQIFNNILGRTTQRAAAAACAAALLLFAGCVRDLAADADGGVNTDADFEFTLPFSVPLADVRTRDQSTSENGIETLWVGMFATAPSSNGQLDGDALLVKTWDLYNLILDGTKTADLTFSMNKYEKEVLNSKLQSWFGDPTLDYEKVNYHFSAIANFKNVKARATMLSQTSGDGELNAVADEYESTDATELVYILRSLNTWREFCSIIIDAQSAFEQRYPLMEGGLSNGTDAASQMLRPEDFTLQNNAAGTAYTHAYSMSDLIKISFGGNDKIRMRRVISNINVILTANLGYKETGDGRETTEDRYESVSIKNIRYSVMNYPKEFYLQERLMAEDPNSLRDIPDTKAILSDREMFEKYAPSVENFDNPADGYWMTSDNAQTTSVPGTYSWTKGGSNKQEFNFGFIRYENKHSGLSTGENGLTEYTDRERVGDNGLFTALCPSGVLENNNYAPYFVIMADMEVVMAGRTEPLNISARYVIHEGYCNNYEGGKSENDLHDFSCVRNTNYTYRVTITGVNSILVSVDVTDEGESRPGVTGDVSSVIENVVFDGEGNVVEGKNTFTLTNDDRRALADKWLVVAPWRAKTDDGEWDYKHVEFGYSSIKVPQTSLVKSYGGDDFYGVDGRNPRNQFTEWVVFIDATGAEKTIGEFASDLSDIAGEGDNVSHEYTVKVNPYAWKEAYQHPFDADSDALANTAVEQPSWSNPDEDARALWLCTEITTGTDGSTYQKIMSVTQTVKDERPKLPEATVTECSSPIYVYERAEIKWNVAADAQNREGVDHYTVTVNGETFTETFDNAGNSYQFTPPMTVEYGETLTFSAVSYPRYAAEYLPSDAYEYEYTVFRRNNTWELGKTTYPGLTTSDTTYSDWVTLSNTLEVRGVNVSQKSSSEGTFVQVGSTADIAANDTNTLRMLIPESGWIRVRFSDTGSNGPRKVAVYANGQEFVSRSASSSNTNLVDVWFKIEDVTEPTYVYIYSPSSANTGGLRYYEIEYTQSHEEEITQWTWNFSDQEWQDALAKAAPGAEDNNVTDWTVSLNGLTYTSGSGNGKWGYESSLDMWFIQPNGGGDATKRVFSFTAPYAGTLRITARSATSGEVRNVTVESGGKTQSIGVDGLTELTFNVSAGEVLVYPGGGIRFYVFDLDCSEDPVEPEPEEPTTWDFASSAWSSVISELAALGDAGSTTLDVTIDGLRLVAGGSNIRANKEGGYIQPNGAGSKTVRCFSFKATTDGTLRVTAQSANSSETRNVTVEDGKTTQSKGVLTKTVLEYSISAGDIYIYPGGGMRFYNIEFDGGVQK